MNVASVSFNIGNSRIQKKSSYSFNRSNYFSSSYEVEDFVSFGSKNKTVVQSYKSKELEILFTEKQIQKRVKQLSKEINDFYGNEPVVIVSVMKGALPFAIDLSKRLNMPVEMEFVRLSSREGSRVPTGQIKEINMDLPDLDGKNVLIVDDIVGTGLTGKYVVDYINQKFNTKSTKFCAFINKQAVREYPFEPDFVGFNVENDKRFVLGYGLDDRGFCRNLPFVGYDEFDAL